MGNPFKRFYDKGKSVVRRVETKGKSYGRRVAQPLAKAQPYITGAITFVAAYAGAPYIGAAYGALAAGVTAPYLGSTAARGKGETGRDAREAGRDQRKKVGVAAALGLTAGVATNLTISAVSSGASTAAPAASTAVAAAKTTLPGGLSASQLVAATAAPGGSILSLGTVTSALGLAAPIVGMFMKPPGPGEKAPSFLEGLLGGALAAAGGGAPGTGNTVEPGGIDQALASPRPFPAWAKVAGAGALAVGGFMVYRSMRKAA